MHDDEVRVDAEVVRALVCDQFPEWALLPVHPLTTSGTVNAIFRLGEELTARFALRLQSADAALQWLSGEAAAQGELARFCPVPTPRPLAVGHPGRGYPMPFAIQTWVPGRAAEVGEHADSAALADDLARVIAALRAAPTRGRTFAGSGRGGSLPDHDGWMATCVELNSPWFDPTRTRRLWAHLRDLPRAGPDAMTHGDLVPGNVILDAGRLTGVLDGGGFGPADPSLDLVAAWHLLDQPPRERMRSALGSSDLEWERGRAWAFQQAMGLVHYYASSNPGMHALGLRTMHHLLADA